MAVTLVEAAKQSQNLIQSAIIEMYARSSDILAVLPLLPSAATPCAITGKKRFPASDSGA